MSSTKKQEIYDTTLNQAKSLCIAIYGKEKKFGITYMRREPITGVVVEIEHSYGTVAEHEPILHEHGAAGWEPYLMVASTTGAGHSKKLVSHSLAIGADFDNGLPEQLERIPLVKPSFAVETSPGKAHFVWIIDEPITVDQMEFLATVISDRFGADAAFARSNQMMRLPGFVNRKNGHKVKLRGAAGNLKHSYDLLCHAFDATLVSNHLRKNNHRLDQNLTIPKNHLNTEAEMVEDVKAALRYLSDLSDGYSDWFRIAQCLVPLGQAGCELFHEFSSRSPKYSAAETDKKWNDALKSKGDFSVKPIFAAAQLRGWKNPGFRTKDSPASNILTDRQFGAKCADKMQDEFAVIQFQPERSRPVMQFLKLENGQYRRLSDLEKRAEVEKVCRCVIVNLGDGINSDVKKEWQRKVGTNRGLEDVCEHIAESLIQRQHGSQVRSFPYLPVVNGVLNLLTRELVDVRYKALPMLSTKVIFDPTKTAPLFARVLNDIFEHDQEMIQFVLRQFGLFLLGRPAKLFFLWYGPTANNGKSLLIKVLMQILGPYISLLPTSTLMVKSHVSDGANPTIAQLDGKRLAVGSEPTSKQELDASLIKQLTGDGFINVRDNYGSPRDMSIEFSLLMSSNFMPKVRDDDRGMWNRILVVPFNRTFSPEESDDQLSDKLAKEASGILNMMLDGAHDYLMNGLNPPDSVRTAISQRREDADPFVAFAADCLIKAAGSTSSLKDTYAAYLVWHKQTLKFRLLTKPELSKRLEGEFKKRTVGHLPVFDGVDIANG